MSESEKWGIGDPDKATVWESQIMDDGTPFEATLTRRKVKVAPKASHRLLPSGYGYLRLTQWTIGSCRRRSRASRRCGRRPAWSSTCAATRAVRCTR